jgi:hypothetical protein
MFRKRKREIKRASLRSVGVFSILGDLLFGWGGGRCVEKEKPMERGNETLKFERLP